MHRPNRSQGSAISVPHTDENAMLDFKTPNRSLKVLNPFQTPYEQVRPPYRHVATPHPAAVARQGLYQRPLLTNMIGKKSPPRAFKDKTNKTPHVDQMKADFYNNINKTPFVDHTPVDIYDNANLRSVKFDFVTSAAATSGACLDSTKSRRKKSGIRQHGGKKNPNFWTPVGKDGGIAENSETTPKKNLELNSDGMDVDFEDLKNKTMKLSLNELTPFTMHGNATKDTISEIQREEEEDVPDIEYCPPPLPEIPFEPSEDLRIDFEFFRGRPSADSYEFQNIHRDDLPLARIDEADMRLNEKKIFTDQELYGYHDCHSCEMDFETLFNEMFGPLPSIDEPFADIPAF